MQQNLERRIVRPPEECSQLYGYVLTEDRAQRIRETLRAFQIGLLANTLKVRLPIKPKEFVTRGEGHFHLAPELFLQTCGTTRFTFPHEELDLNPGELLVVPPRLLHAERIHEDSQGELFNNVVVYAEGTALICHQAHDQGGGKPLANHMEARHHRHAPRIHDWLADATRLGWGEDAPTEARLSLAVQDLIAVQMRALVASACAGSLMVLDESELNTKPEHALVARVRMWIQNRMGDQELSVISLATQAGCTPDYLSYLFSHTTGEHLVAYINRQRMQRAARLLTETAMAGKEVAWVCGFSTPSYFIKMFHAHYGITPKNWRAKRMNDLGDSLPADL